MGLAFGTAFFLNAVTMDAMSDEASNDCDLIVAGGGAAGLFAAARAAELGARVILLEKNRRAGVKILISGGTRCNVTNARGLRVPQAVSGPIDPAFDLNLCQGSKSIARAFGHGESFLRPALRALDVDATVRRFESLGVPLKIEANGKIFPVSDHATDVLAALVNWLERSGAQLRVHSPVQSIERTATGFRVDTPQGAILSPRVVLCVGGASYPGCGTTGDGYSIARALGHTLVQPRPALVPLHVEACWVAKLKGIATRARARVLDPSGRILAERTESVLFTHFGLSGPAILDVSRVVSEDRSGLKLELDLLPEISLDDLDRQIQAASRRGRPLIASLIPGEMPRRLAESLTQAASIPPGRAGPDLSRDERKRLIAAIKQLQLPIQGTMGFAKAEVTTGGVALEEVDSMCMESKRAPGIHLAGEILDLDGPIGGYNFQAAWSTGWLAGETAALRRNSGS